MDNYHITKKDGKWRFTKQRSYKNSSDQEKNNCIYDEVYEKENWLCNN